MFFKKNPEGDSEVGKTATAIMGSDIPRPVSRGDGTPTVRSIEGQGPEAVGLENGAWSQRIILQS